MSTGTGAAHRKLTQRTAIEAALSNEQVTRTRVDRLEQWMYGPHGEPKEIDPGRDGIARSAIRAEWRSREAEQRAKELRIADVARLDVLEAWRRRGFWGRLRWLVRGK